jgi:hypothetical protein
VVGLAALLILAPLLLPGCVLTYDMVFVPRPALTRELLGLGTSVARAVPSDLLVALAGRALPADWVQKLVLAGALVGGGLGAARLAPTALPAGRAAAGVLYLWNAFVYERLLMGHWALLVSYAALPWVVLAAAAYRSDDATGPNGAARPAAMMGSRWAGPRPLRRLAAALAVAAVSPPGGIIATVLALLVVGFPGRQQRGAQVRRLALVGGLALVVNAPWWVPSVLHPGGVPVRPVGVAAFASRPDGPLGTVGSLVTLGGIWNANVVPPGRGSLLWLPAFALVVVVAVAGWRRCVAAGRLDGGAVAGLLTAAGVGLLVAAAGALPGLDQGVRFAVEHLPGGGLLRDGQKFVAPLAVALAAGFGAGVEWLAGLLATPARRRVAAGLLVVTPLLLLPTLAWGAWGRLGVARYPASWAEARAAVAADPVPGALLVLPWHLYVGLPWNHDRVVLQPAQRYFPRRVVTNDDLELPGLIVPGEDPWSPRLAPLVLGSRPLAPGLPAAGVRWVLVEKLGPWSAYPPRLAGAELVLDRGDLALYRGPPPRRVELPGAPAAPVILADVVVLMLLGWIAAGSLAWFRRRLIESRNSEGGIHG